MKKIAIFFLCTAIMMAFSTFSASAQEPVSWNAEVQMTSDNEGIVTLTGTIEPGWHVYGTKLPDVGPQPTKLSYAAKGLVWVGNAKMRPAPKKEMDQMFDAELSYWDSKVTFTRKFRCEDPEKVEITVGVNYMCCNESTCRPPKTEKFTVKPTKE